MALSSSILDKIKKDAEDKKKGIKRDESSAKATSGSKNSQSSTSSTLSSSTKERIAKDLALKKMGFTHNKDTGLLNDPRYKDIYTAASTVNGEYINKFLTDFNSYAPQVQSAYENLGWKAATSGTLDDLFGRTGDDLKYRMAMVGSYLASQKDDLDEETYNGLTSQLSSISEFMNQYGGAYSSAKDFYAQFDSEEAYNTWQSKESFINEYLSDPEKAMQTHDYDQRWLREAQYRAENSKVTGAEDFRDFSRYASTEMDDWWERAWSQYSMGYGDLTYEYINNQNDSRNDIRSEIAKKQRVFSADTKNGTDYKIYDYMSDDDVAVYNYYYAKDGKDRADEYLDSIRATLEARANQETVERVSKTASEHPFLSSVASVGTSLASGFEYIEDVLDYGADKITGRNAHLGTNENALVTNAIRGTVSDMVDWEISNWDAFDFLYSTAMSGADSLTSGLVFGNLGGAVLGLSAAAQGTNDALDRGMSNGQAFWNGLFSGVFEGLFETVSIGNFQKLKEVAPDSVKTIFKNLGKSMLVNASEEALTEIANIGYDTLINGDFANYTWEELKNGAWWDALKQVIEAGASGALMGFGMGGIGNAIGYSKGNKAAERAYGSDPGALVSEALEVNPDNAFAQKMQGRVDSGKGLSGRQLNRLNDQIVEGDVQAIQAAAAQRLTELGETGDVNTIAQALTKQAAGQELSKAEKRAISNSKYGSRVANELNTENIRSGDYASGWAESIGTHRINAQEYGRMLQAAQSQQKAAETTGEQVAAEVQNEAQAPQVEPEVATVRENRTVAENATVKESLQVAEEISDAQEVQEEGAVTLEEVSKKYGAQAKAMIHTYQAGQDVAKFDKAYQAAYDMGRSGVALSYVHKSEMASYLTDSQKELAYEAGKAAADAKAIAKDAANKAAANGKTGWKKGGVVRGEGVTISDLRKAVGDTRGKAYKSLSTIAKVTGINIVLYKSQTDTEGNFIDSQGAFDPNNPNEIRIDINAGLQNINDVDDLEKYVLLRTFSHEFTHFIEKWNPIQYNEFRREVFDTMTQRGEDVNRLIELQQEKNPGMGYEAASREVVAESMTDILPDANFVQTLAEKHQNIFKKLLEKLKEFVQNLREYFDSIGYNDDAGAKALKEDVGGVIRYVDSIVKLFDKVAVQTVENFQTTVATEKVVVSQNENTTTADKTAAVAKNATTSNENSNKTTTVSETESVAEQSDFEKAFWNATQEERDEVVDAINQNINISHIAPTEIRESAEISEEVSTDGTEETGTVLPHRGDGQGTARLLGEVEAGAVPGAESAGEPVGSSGQRGNETGRHDRRDDAKRHERGHGEGSGQSRDLRPDGERNGRDRGDGAGSAQPGEVQPVSGDSAHGGRGLNAEDVTDNNVGSNDSMNTHAAAKEYAAKKGYRIEINKTSAKKRIVQVDIYDKNNLATFNPVIINDASDWAKVKDAIDKREAADAAKAKQLHEETVEQIAQQSTEQPKGRNFVIGDSLDLPNGEKARYKANVEAIRLVKKLEAEGRYATEAEQVILSKYVGWGGLANAFDQRKTEWAKEFAELKELLTDEEYSSARGSTLNAHYTDISVIRAMYDGLKQLGFTGGRMMEPSSGVGNFVGAMPADMASQVRSWTMVELDGITGLIAKYLYPNADVRIQGFEKANIPNNFMDVAISNVPFGNYAIADKSYPKKVTSAIHNYFFAKSLDKVRPGGIVMFITSSYTMNSSDSTVRRYIMQKADLLGAIRLPDTAFKGNAGTEVVTDILILKKRAENTSYSGEDFLEAPYTRPIRGNFNGAYINDYFNNHPEMVLGTASFEGGMYRGNNLTYKALEGKGSLADQIREAFKNIQGKMEYPAKVSPEKTNFAVERAGKKTKENGLVVKDGKVYRNTGGELVEQKVANGAAERIAGMLEIRDAAKALQNAQQQGLKETEIKKARTALNKAYDAFVKKYGYINSQANKNAIKDDPDKFSIFALENWNPETKKATKADIFSKNTIAANRTVTSAKDVADGLIVSVNQTGGVDATLIAKLTGKTEAEVTRELLDSRQVFKNRDGGLETAEVYLSGNVRAKLRDAEALVSLDADYQKNVEALKAVMPEDVGYEDIFVNPGTPWIPDSVYSDFAAYMLGGRNTDWRKDVVVTRNKDTGNFTVELGSKYLKTNAANTQKWGTSRRSFLDLFDAMLNSKSVVVKYKTDDGKSVIDQDATAAANEKVENIKKEFQEWLWKDEGRRAELATLYNETFNSIVTPKYNGDNLTVNGANAMKPLRPHQRNAVQRIIASGGNTLLAHKVGAGKTYEMAAAAMKLKELGLVKKPMFAVPKSLVAQWGNEFMDFFPTAKLLVAEASDFTAANRKVFMNRIANGEYDAVIVSYEQFERLPVSDEFTRELYQEQIESVIRAIEEAKADKGGKSLSVKDLEKKRKQLQTKIDKLSDSAKDEDNIDFEQLGVDSIFVDEAHNFKNLFYTTSMTNVSGLGNKDGSKRAFDLYTKVRYLQKLNGGRGIVFATATPVMNSMSEMYIMQKYLQPDLLDQLGLSTFDAWAKQFGEVVNGVEIKPSGQGYRVKQSFSRFKNMSELQLLFRNFADVLTDIPGLKIPKMKGGNVNVVVCEPGQFQQDYMKELEKRADNIKNVDPSVDNMLKITSDGRKISYTQRMIDPSLPYEEGCKIYRCADNVLTKYQESQDVKGTQIIFCDMATPKGKSSTAATETEEIETDMESAKLYDDIKARLVKGGIPAKEIAFIHEADTDAKKKKLFADVNDGKVRVLIGSTGKMGVGMNAQKRIVAIHHLDAPWRPGDVEQRNGRAYRQGNINDEVENFTYVTEGSFDARLWDILERKQNFINQVMNGENVGRETEDTGEVTLSAAEVKALASGSPLIMEQVQLDTDIKKLESLQRAHRSAVANARSRLEMDKGNIATYQKFVENGKKDLAARVDTYSEGKFSITLGKRKFTDKKEAGAELMAVATAKATEEGYTTIGKFAGFDLRVIKTHEGIKGQITGSQGYSFNTYPGNITYMISHLIGKVEGIEEAVKLWEHKTSEAKQDMAEQEKLINQPFAKQAELDQKRARYNEVMEILNPKEEQQLSSMEEDAVQYQQRKNTLTNREVLALAASELQKADLSAAERDALGIFQQRLAKLETLQEERAELGRLYKEQQFGTKVDREAAEQTRNRMKIMDGQIEKAKAEVLSIEDKQVLKQVLEKARKVVEKQQFAKDEEKLKRYRDRRNNADAIKKYRDRLTKDVNDLTNWVLHPNNKDVVKHIPDVLKNSVIPFLSSIDLTSKRQLRGGDETKADKEFMKRLNGLKAALKPNQSVDGLYGDYSDLPPNFMERLQLLIDSAQAIVEKKSGEFVVNQMTSQELRELSQVVRTLKTYIQQFNRFHANAMFQHVSEAGDNTIGELGQMGNASSNTGNVSNFVFWQQIRPAYAWERFGQGGKAIYDGLRRGQAKLAFNTKTIQEFAEKAYTEAEVKAWEKQIKSIKLGNDIVQMPISTIMSFYELSKRTQALGHILGGGIRVATFTVKGKKISDTGHTITLGDVQTIIGTLTDRQKEVADKLQKFMQEQGGKWGNYVSVKRFGEELFGEEHYFPINSDGRHLAANADEHPSAASLYALLNMGFTKSIQEGANNRIVLYSIFDVFANHMASMAQYNAFALPVVDAIKWFNYQQKSEADEDGKRIVLGSVRDQMDRVYGVPDETRPGSGRQGYAQGFVINILRAFNGTEAQGVPTDSTGLNALRQYNMAQVAFNFRVVVQQPLAITRAALLVDYGSIIKGMRLNPAVIRKNIQEMQRYSGIAAWKGLGFYDVNISRGLTDIIKHSATWRDKISEVGMWGAEKADVMTWAGIWSACKEEVIKKQRLTPKDEGFYDAVTELFEEVIYKTQVVDSVLTKNEYMRSKGFFARATGSFMSEPTTTASMLIDAYDKYHADMQRGMNRQQAWKKNGKAIVRTVYVYGLSAAILAAVQAVADAFRDDDDYQEWYEKWLEAFGGNLVDESMPLNKLPILSDFYEVAKELLSILGVDTYGNAPTSVFMQWYDSLVKGVEILHDKIKGEDIDYTWYGGAYKLLQAVSGMTGLPMAAATREIVTVWNNVVGAMAPSLKVKTYDPGDQNNIKYAYQDGYLTDEEATAELLEKGLVETEDEAYWTIQGWEAGDGYSRYGTIFDAVRNGGDFNAAMRELTSHGHKEKDVLSEVKGKIGEWYRDGEITKAQAQNMLTRYTDMDSEDVEVMVNKWSSKIVTGIAFDDIKDEYLDGNMTAARAIEMYVRYGGYTQEKATETVSKWGAEKETGIAYDDIKDAFMDGELSEADARNMYTTYGEYSEEDAAEKAAALAFEKEYGFEWSKRGDAYKSGEISASVLRNALMSYGEKTAEEADLQIQAYDWEAEGYENVTAAAVREYEEHCAAYKVPKDSYLYIRKFSNDTKNDVDANGKTIYYSAMKKVMAEIGAQNITAAQKDAIARSLGWAEKNIRKYKTW